jgi:hypothetical protein
VRARVTALLAASVIGLTGVAGAAPNDVVADYFVDGQLDGIYSVDDLRGALAFAQERAGGGAQYSAFADIVSQAITRDLAGTGAAEDQLRAQSLQSRTQPAPPPAPTATVPRSSGLPTPPPSDPGDQLPLAVPMMALGALGLIAVGSLSAIWRRRRGR